MMYLRVCSLRGQHCRRQLVHCRQQWRERSDRGRDAWGQTAQRSVKEKEVTL